MKLVGINSQGEDLEPEPVRPLFMKIAGEVVEVKGWGLEDGNRLVRTGTAPVSLDGLHAAHTAMLAAIVALSSRVNRLERKAGKEA